ncbi:hypothetical protein [Maribacter sp. 2307UL18-2]|uniref:hypothetical protein n=1 Tax=Maribacter sp. 2307UL18-2 TaxID=3386274 RepID=UPI0039BD640E
MKRPAKRKKDDTAEIEVKLKHLFAKDKFARVKPNGTNVNEIFENNLKIWLLNNSDETQVLHGESVVISNGVMENPENVITGNTKEGFELTATDFISAELDFLSGLSANYYSIVEGKQLAIYKGYLEQQRKVKAEFKISFRDSFYEVSDYEKVMAQLNEYSIASKVGNKHTWNVGSESRLTLMTAFYDTLLDNGLIRKHRTLQEAADAINNHFHINYHRGYFKRHREYEWYEGMRNDFHFIPKRVK